MGIDIDADNKKNTIMKNNDRRNIEKRNLPILVTNQK